MDAAGAALNDLPGIPSVGSEDPTESKAVAAAGSLVNRRCSCLFCSTRRWRWDKKRQVRAVPEVSLRGRAQAFFWLGFEDARNLIRVEATSDVIFIEHMLARRVEDPTASTRRSRLSSRSSPVGSNNRSTSCR